MSNIRMKSNLRILFAIFAFVGFVVFSIYSNLLVNQYALGTYGWRLGVLNSLFLMMPYLALLTFSIMERVLTQVNRRIYIIGIFALYLIQTVYMFVGGETASFSVFCSPVLGTNSSITTIILIARIVVLFLVPVADRIMLKIYSLSMISLFGFSLIVILTSDYYYLRDMMLDVILPLTVDIVFHIALYFYSDFMDKENESKRWMRLLEFLSYPIFGDSIDEDEEIDWIDAEKEDKCISTEYSTEYKKILICVLKEADNDFLQVHTFFEMLSKGIIAENNIIHPVETYVSRFTAFAEKINVIKSKRPGYISEDFINLIDVVLAEKDEGTFMLDVITIAKMIFDPRLYSWLSAVKQYSQYKYNEMEGEI